MQEKLSALAAHLIEVEQQLADPAVYTDREKLTALRREQKELAPVVECWQAYLRAQDTAREAEEMLSDPELRALAQEELAGAKGDMERLQEELKRLLLQRDPIYPILMARLHAALPGYEFAVDTRPVSRNPHEMLCSEADAALYLPFGPLQPEVESRPIIHNTFYLIVSPEHPLTGRSTLALADLAGQQLFYEPLYQEMVDLAVVQPGLPFSAPSWHMVENYECVYNDLLAGRGMFLCPMKYPAFPAAWYLPLQLPLPDTCLLTLRDDPRPEIQRLREVFTAVYASRAKLLGEE